MKYQAENAVSSFFYYMWNAWSKEECKVVFGDMYRHFWDKWSALADKSIFGAAERFFAELSENNQKLLVERAVTLYDGRAFRKEPDDSDILVCKECGSRQLEIQAWINANTDERISYVHDDNNGLWCDGKWCEECGVQVFFCTKAEFTQKTAENQERVLALEQQLQFQAKNMEAASQLYTAQRHKVHDFRAHLNILQGLLQNQEYDAAEQYLNSVTKEQTDRLFLVNSHHSILDALFNTKATEAIRKGIDIDFKLNDLSTLPFDVSDMVVLFSNLLDNAIEACEKVDGNRVIRVSVVLKRSLLFSIRNTTLPVKIKNDTIQTTKPNASLHGFGLSNIKLILNKYHADFVMDYTDGWFQFTGEIEI